MDVRKMNFNERNANARQRIANGNACVCIGGRIDYDESDAIPTRLLDAVDQCAFVIALKALHIDASGTRRGLQPLVDFGQRFTTVEFRFTRTEQVKIRSVQNQNRTLAAQCCCRLFQAISRKLTAVTGTKTESLPRRPYPEVTPEVLWRPAPLCLAG